MWVAIMKYTARQVEVIALLWFFSDEP